LCGLHYRRGPDGELLLWESPPRLSTPRTEETREAIARRLEFFVSLPHGRGQRDHAKNETAQHFNVEKRTIERDLVKAKRALKVATGRQLGAMADWALSVLEGAQDKTVYQLVDEITRERAVGALCGLLSMSL
jgi:hypothetical protein